MLLPMCAVFLKVKKGDYVIELDGRSYFFMRNNASIVLKFDDDGIKSIAIDGVTKDMGTKS